MWGRVQNQLYLIQLEKESKLSSETRGEWSKGYIFTICGWVKGMWTNCTWYGWEKNWATETREGGSQKKHIGRQPFPQLYQIRLVLVTFIIRLRCYRYVAIECVFLGCLPPPRETCPGRRPQAPAFFKCIQFKIIYIYNIYIYMKAFKASRWVHYYPPLGVPQNNPGHRMKILQLSAGHPA